MQQILNFFIKYHIFFLFIFLESVALFFTISKNKNKTERFLTSANVVSGLYFKNTDAVSDYFSLRSQNTNLKNENLELKKRLSAYTFFSQKNDQII